MVFSVNSMLNTFSGQEVNDLDVFATGITKLLRYAPDLLKDCYCIWLGVPVEDRDYIKDELENLTDDEGQEIIEIFIDQNAKELRSFFDVRVRNVAERAKTKAGPARAVSPIEALEAYTEEHPEKVDDLLKWPAIRFESFYAAFQKRKLVEKS